MTKPSFPVQYLFFIDRMGWGLALPILTPLFLSPNEVLFPPEDPLQIRTVLLGFVLALYPLAQLLGAPFLEEAMKGASARRTLFFSAIGSMCGFFLTGIGIWVNSLALIAASRLITGFFAGKQSILITGMFAKDSEGKPQYLSTSVVIGSLAFIVGIAAGGILTDVGHHLAYARPFWILGFLMALGVIIILRSTTIGNLERHPTTIDLFRGLTLIYESLLLTPFRTCFLALICFYTSLVIWMQYLPAFLFFQLQRTPKEVGITYAVLGLLWTICIFILERWRQKMGDRHVLLYISLAIYSVLMAILGLVGYVWEVDFVDGLLMIFGAICWTQLAFTLFRYVLDLLHKEAFSLIATATLTAGVFGALLGSFVLDVGGVKVFLLAAVFSIISCLLMYSYHKKMKILLASTAHPKSSDHPR